MKKIIIPNIYRNSSIVIVLTQNYLKHKMHKIKFIQDAVIRWNRTFKMLESIIFNEDALKSMAMLPECKCTKDYVPNSEKFD